MPIKMVLCRVFDILGIGKPDMSDFNNRLKYQKIVYLLQSSGLSLGYGFKWYLKGPYSSHLASALYLIESDPEIYENSEHIVFKYNDKVVNKLSEFKDKLGEHINDVLYLEVLASLHYIDMASFCGEGNISDLKTRLFEIKPDLEKQENINEIIGKAYKDLDNYKLT